MRPRNCFYPMFQNLQQVKVLSRNSKELPNKMLKILLVHLSFENRPRWTSSSLLTQVYKPIKQKQLFVHLSFHSCWTLSTLNIILVWPTLLLNWNSIFRLRRRPSGSLSCCAPYHIRFNCNQISIYKQYKNITFKTIFIYTNRPREKTLT